MESHLTSHKGMQQQMKKVTNDLKTARKQKDGISQSLPFNNFFKYESLNSQIKTKEWLVGLKKTRLNCMYAAYKRLTSVLRTHTGSK